MSDTEDAPLVGRVTECNRILSRVSKGQSIILIGDSGSGKTAIVETLNPLFEEHGRTLSIERCSPFSSLIREMFDQMWHSRMLGDELEEKDRYKDQEEDRKAWGKKRPSNDLKARGLAAALKQWTQYHTKAVLVVDDVSGLTPSIRPWLIEWTNHATLILTATPGVLKKAGSSQLWKLLERIHLPALTQAETGQLVDRLSKDYKIVCREPGVYRNRVIALSQGNPGEVVRIIKHLSPEAIIKSEHVLSVGESFGAREERGIALLPIIAAIAVMTVAWRYVARAQGDMNAYVLSGIMAGLVGVFMLLGRPLIKKG
jgi:energy-coupling factor transporter ATP-binding protein EcfA2